MNFTAPDAKILAVDDQEINLMVLEQMLSDTRATLETATSGEDMLAMLAQKKYDVVLLDHIMPGLDGLAAFHKAQELAENPNKNTPFVALTGNDAGNREETRAFYKKEGFADFLPKPVNPAELEKTLTALLFKKSGLLARAMDYLDEDAADESQEEEAAVMPQPDNDAVLDAAYGLSFAAGDSDIYKGVMKTYTDSFMENGYSISKALKNEDWDKYRILVHSLKSSSRMIGAMKLGALSEQLEHAARDGDTDCIRQNNTPLLALYSETVDACTNWMQEN